MENNQGRYNGQERSNNQGSRRDNGDGRDYGRREDRNEDRFSSQNDESQNSGRRQGGGSGRFGQNGQMQGGRKSRFDEGNARMFSDDMGAYGDMSPEWSDTEWKNREGTGSLRRSSFDTHNMGSSSQRNRGGYSGSAGESNSECFSRDRESFYGNEGSQGNSGLRNEMSGSQHNGNSKQKSSRGQHYGKGPKGFAFSDEELKREVSRELYRHGDVDASEVTIEVKDGEVTLTGTVDSRETKRLIEEYIEDEVSGVQDVNNQLRVKKAGILSSIVGSANKDEEKSSSYSSTSGSSKKSLHQ